MIRVVHVHWNLIDRLKICLHIICSIENEIETRKIEVKDLDWNSSMWKLNRCFEAFQALNRFVSQINWMLKNMRTEKRKKTFEVSRRSLVKQGPPHSRCSLFDCWGCSDRTVRTAKTPNTAYCPNSLDKDESSIWSPLNNPGHDGVRTVRWFSQLSNDQTSFG